MIKPLAPLFAMPMSIAVAVPIPIRIPISISTAFAFAFAFGFASAFATGAAHAQGSTEIPSAALPAGAAECLAELEQVSERVSDDLQRPDGTNDPLIGDICPELASEIAAGVWGESLLDLRAEDLSSGSLQQLLGLIERYDRDTRSAFGLATEDLAAHVDALRPFEPLPEISVWDRVMRWLQERLGLDRVDPGDRLLEWLRSIEIPNQWIRPIILTFGSAVVLLALAVTVYELRRSGALPLGMRSRRHYPGYGAAEDAPLRVIRFEDLRRAPPHKQPALLLAMILDRMRAKYSSSIRDSLTHRELVVAADMLAPPGRASFESVVGAAERVTFADWTPSAADIAPLLAEGESLLGDLSVEPDAHS